MNEEEKQAIGFLKHSLYEYEEIDTSVMEYIDKNHKIIYKLILKQQKEIEELKKKNEPQPDCAEPVERTEKMVNMKWVNYNYISKDKIKELKEFYIKDYLNRNITLIPLNNLVKNINILLGE